MLGRDSLAYQQIAEASKYLMGGVVIGIDPSVGSYSSMPGYSVYMEGILVDSGILQLPAGQPLHVRLRKLGNAIRRLYREYDPDVLVYEEIPAQRHGGNASAHASLLKAVGVILSVPGPTCYVGLYPLSWKKMVRDSYVKGDEEDAIELGYIAIEEAKRISEEVSRKKRIRKKK